MNKVQELDIAEFVRTFPLSSYLESTSILITGATGLVGSTLVRCLLAIDKNISITIPVRNKEKAIAIYGVDVCRLRIVECNLVEYCVSLSDSFDYIIHCASPTSSKFLNEYPVETYELSIDSTRALLRYAYRYKVKSLVFVSSLEYYGQNNNDQIITEDFLGYIDIKSPRSSYPLAKRAAEYLCVAYAHEFGVPVKVARLTQTFGAGVSEDDNRVYAQFARSIIAGRNIIMHTLGDSSKPYCYTTDCASAIFTILLRGKNGEAYNVANQDTYISIKDLAEFLRNCFNPKISVIVEEHYDMGYAPITKLFLSSEKLKGLGWKPQYDLKEMFRRLIEGMKIDNDL